MAKARIVRSAEGERFEPLWLGKFGSLQGGRFDFFVGALPYLYGPPLHVHREQDDTFFVLEGVLTIQAGDEVIDLYPGDFVTIPPGVPHTFDNTRQDQAPVRVCNIMTPSGLDSMFRDVMQLESRPHDDAERQALRERYGVTLVGPTLGVKLGLV